ncbi:D-alanyl-D-alanine carboxypeptidase [Rhodococcus rhodnii]|uniref:Serine-type D-Ala-D-Ala carboxypeptidase n=2 Tax=Rhodococcus rhodnii TaxID=38312 RepID=R7WJI5_9NOCA|nr:D-alanyl-D-alanine carboxypeptidase family protein [Rhodococcus rhodnii]EOM75453.1 serine-type D-Ala-D-Ala carboxypeptidase [Rhodococcus rhodnii LMG 5362]TXG90522.1 D-alanyl-D-alanine carboxypeptidase [Rhodococcus rhodnii]
MHSPRKVAASAACSLLVALGGSGALAGTAAAAPAPATADHCPLRYAPAANPVDTPGPEPLPVPNPPVGGDALGSCDFVAAPDAPPLPGGVDAQGWMISDVNTGEVIAAHDAHGRYRPASVIKVLLALVALDELDMNKTVVALQEDEDIIGSRVGVGPHGTYSIHTVLQGLMMASGNDTANMLAREMGGVPATLDKMNAKAHSLGALDTRAATPSGLDGPGMSSSPYDMSLIFRAALQNPTFRELVSAPEVFFPGYPKDPNDPADYDRPGFVLTNDNGMLYNYPGAIGGKTGFTDAARHTYVGAADRDGRTLQVTMMGGELTSVRPWQQATYLLDWAFAQPAGVSVGTLNQPEPEPAVELAALPPSNPAPAETNTAATAELTEAAAQSSDTGVRAGVVTTGVGVVLALLGAAWMQKRRHDHRG